ncbi:MAG TPA: hypothetical protein VHM24_13430 [Gemmatimonadaceae bacterium]|nr:hypothetical protein [Gemmatimonadaceae bacterium]
MLIDTFLPNFDVSERHRVRVMATQAATYAALREADLAESSLARALMFLRAMPSTLSRGLAGVREFRNARHEAVTLGSFEDRGFRILAEDPPREIVIGLEGKFWLPSGALCTPVAEAFRNDVIPAGMARAVWNFTVGEDGAETELATETRVLCADAATRRRFLPYWALIRIGSGLIRGAMLASIKRTAERQP